MKTITIRGSARIIEDGEPQDGYDFEFSERCGIYAHQTIFVNSTSDTEYKPSGMDRLRLLIIDPDKPVFAQATAGTWSACKFLVRGPLIVRMKPPGSDAFKLANADDYPDGNRVRVWFAGDPEMPEES